jgi:hypothetical protein
MREGEERAGRFVPVLQRIIILLAVLIAVPVTLWMVTGYIRAYVGPPKIPTARQMSAIAPANPPPAADTATGVGNQSQQAVEPTKSAMEARATVSDVPSVPVVMPAANDPSRSNLLADSHRSAPAISTVTASADPSVTGTVQAQPAGNSATDAPHPPPAGISASGPQTEVAATPPTTVSPQAKTAELLPPPSSAPASATASAETPNLPVAPQSTAAPISTPEAIPAATPLAGPIPLPRRRPRAFALADGAIPVPRPRPANAEPPSASETSTAGPLDWLQNVFH